MNNNNGNLLVDDDVMRGQQENLLVVRDVMRDQQEKLLVVHDVMRILFKEPSPKYCWLLNNVVLSLFS